MIEIPSLIKSHQELISLFVDSQRLLITLAARSSDTIKKSVNTIEILQKLWTRIVFCLTWPFILQNQYDSFSHIFYSMLEDCLLHILRISRGTFLGKRFSIFTHLVHRIPIYFNTLHAISSKIPC
jgi:hypothetical protein